MQCTRTDGDEGSTFPDALALLALQQLQRSGDYLVTISVEHAFVVVAWSNQPVGASQFQSQSNLLVHHGNTGIGPRNLGGRGVEQVEYVVANPLGQPLNALHSIEPSPVSHCAIVEHDVAINRNERVAVVALHGSQLA